MNKKILLVIFAIFIKLGFSAISFHSDIQHFDFAGQVIISGHFLNFYDYVSSIPKESSLAKLANRYVFNYPPGVYFLLGPVDGILTSFEDQNFHQDFLFNFASVLGDVRLNFHLLILKLPYLVFDFGSLFLISKIFTIKKEKNLAFYLWLFNPITLYGSYLMGQFDIIPVFFVLLAYYFISKEKFNLSLAALSLGIGAILKIYPLFLLVPLATLTHDFKERIKIISIGALPYILAILPFLPSKGFRTSALVADQTLKSFYAQIPVSGGESIFLFMGSLLFVYLIFLKFPVTRENIWKRFYITLLLFFIFTHYHPQWFLWVTPFIIFDLVKGNFKNILEILLMLASFSALLFFFDPGLTVGLFSPINPSLYTAFNASNIWQILRPSLDINFARSFFQTIFAGCAFYIIYFYFPRKEDSK